MKVIYSNLPTYSGAGACDHLVPLDPCTSFTITPKDDVISLQLDWLAPDPDFYKEVQLNELKTVQIYRSESEITDLNDAKLIGSCDGKIGTFEDSDVKQEHKYFYLLVPVSMQGVKTIDLSTQESAVAKPRPVHTCNFYDITGQMVYTEDVKEGDYILSVPEGPAYSYGTFKQWSPDVFSPVKGPTNFYPVYTWSNAELAKETITDTWPQIIANMDAGNYDQYAKQYKIAVMDQPYLMQCGGRLKDNITGSSEKAKMTWISRTIRNATNTAIGDTAYDGSTIKSTIESCFAKLPSYVKDRVVDVDKDTYTFDMVGGSPFETLTTGSYKAWPVSVHESITVKGSGVFYSDLFDDRSKSGADPKKNINYRLTGAEGSYWLRDCGRYNSTFGAAAVVQGSGALQYLTEKQGTTNYLCGVCPCFCLN